MTPPSRSSAPRALVLGGGGLAGIAWEVGVIVGLAEGGADVGDAERVVGTSAGSVVGALVATGADLATIHAAHREPRPVGSGGGAPPARLDGERLAGMLATAFAGATDARDARARIGAAAIAADTPPEAERREIIAARLPDHRWPARDLRVTAVDARSGEAVVFTADDGVELVDAVAASCALDGGARSIVGLDVVDEPTVGGSRPAGTVVVVAPLDPPAGGPMETVEAEAARRRVARPDDAVITVLADAESRAAFGPDVLDPASMAPSAAAGRRQGLAAAPEVARAWRR